MNSKHFYIVNFVIIRIMFSDIIRSSSSNFVCKNLYLLIFAFKHPIAKSVSGKTETQKSMQYYWAAFNKLKLARKFKKETNLEIFINIKRALTF